MHREPVSTRAASVILGTALASVLLAAPAEAEESEPAAQIAEDAIIVTAQKRDQAIIEVPFSVAVLDDSDLERSSITDIFGLGGRVPGLEVRTVTPPSAGTAFAIRGLGTSVFNLGFESSVGTYVDGIYRSRSGLVAGSDLLDLERIEVLKGPQGTLFGKNSSAGVIHFITAAPKFTQETEVHAGYGNRDAVELQAIYNAPISSQLAVRFSAGYAKVDGFIEDLANDRSYAGKDRYSLRGQLLYEPNPQISLRIIADYGQADELSLLPIRSRGGEANLAFNQALAGAAGSTYPSIPTAEDWKTAINQEPELEVDDWGISSELQLDLGEIRATSLTSYRSYKDGLLTDFDFTGVRTLISDQKHTAKTFSQEFRFAGSMANFAAGMDWIIGAFYANEDIKRFNEFIWDEQIGLGAVGLLFGNVSGTAFTDRLSQKADSYGLFAHAITQLSAKAQLTAGFRQSWDRKSGIGVFTARQPLPLPVVYDFGKGSPIPARVSDSGLSGTASLTYAVSPQTRLFATYSRGYKAGGISLIRDAAGVQIGFSPIGIPEGCVSLGGPAIGCQPGDPTFEKESVDHFEVGSKTTFGSGTLNLAGFHTKISDLQTQLLQPSGTFQVSNIGSATSRGIDFEASISPFAGVTLNGSLVYAQVTDDDGEDIDHAPRWMGALGAAYEKPLGRNVRGFASGGLTFRSKYFTDDQRQFTQGSYQLVNARIGIGRGDGRWEISAWCRNCLNRNFTTVDFRIPLDGGAFNDGSTTLSFVGESRRVGISVRFKS